MVFWTTYLFGAWLLAMKDVQVNWLDERKQVLNIQMVGGDALAGTCLKSGLELEYRYSVQICKRRPLWLDSCTKSWERSQILSYDPITIKYRLLIDTFDDRAEAETQIFESRNRALAGLRQARGMPLTSLAEKAAELLSNRRTYLTVRVQSNCKGDYNETLAKLSSFLSLGFVQIAGFDTGWVDFNVGSEIRR